MKYQKFSRLPARLFITICILCLLPVIINAGGISVDAGITPPEDRWILRTLFHFTQRKDDLPNIDQDMKTYMVPIVLAYGVRPYLTILLKQPIVHREMSMAGTKNEKTGLGDLLFLVKYKLYRRNTSRYILGIAPTLGLESPTGSDPFSSNTWDLYTGLYSSWRYGSWATDFNIAFTLNGFAEKEKVANNSADKLALDMALAYQWSIRGKASISLTPILEINYNKIFENVIDGQDLPGNGEAVLYVSPGIKYSTSTFFLEALLQLPVWQQHKAFQLDYGIGILAGFRYLF